jgi:predicted nucleic acid-binding protein
MSAVLDTSVLIDYLRGVRQAKAVLARFPHASIAVTAWVDVMAVAPARLEVQTRDFLRGFERLAINEAIADRAVALMRTHAGLEPRYALPWATALANSLLYVTVDFPQLTRRERTVVLAYRDSAAVSRAG